MSKIHFAVTMTTKRGHVYALDVFAADRADAISQARKHYNREMGLTRYTGNSRTFTARHAINCECKTCSGISWDQPAPGMVAQPVQQAQCNAGAGSEPAPVQPVSEPVQELPADAVAALGLSIRSEFVPFSRSRNAKPVKTLRDLSLNWKVTLVYKDRDVLTTDYGAGIAHCPSHGSRYANRITADQSRMIQFECEHGRKARQYASIGGVVGTGKTLEPDSLDVIYSLSMDSSVLDYAGFEDWASNYGYEPDSRSAEKIYQACLSIALQLRNTIGQAGLDRLSLAFQDY